MGLRLPPVPQCPHPWPQHLLTFLAVLPSEGICTDAAAWAIRHVLVTQVPPFWQGLCLLQWSETWTQREKEQGAGVRQMGQPSTYPKVLVFDLGPPSF